MTYAFYNQEYGLLWRSAGKYDAYTAVSPSPPSLISYVRVCPVMRRQRENERDACGSGIWWLEKILQVHRHSHLHQPSMFIELQHSQRYPLCRGYLL